MSVLDKTPYKDDNLKNLIDIEKDILMHPSDDLTYLDKVFKSELFSKEDIKNINEALNIILKDERLSENERGGLLQNSWKINHIFYINPELFLTEKWIGSMALDIFPHIKENFLNFFNPLNGKNIDLLYDCIGFGKSTLVGLLKLYRAVYTLSLRNPKQYFKLARSTRLTDISISFTKSTTYDLVLKPMISIMECSDMFEKMRYERNMNNPEYANSGKILWCNTSKGNSIIRIGDVYFDMACEPIDIVGRNIISLSATELAFLCESMPEEKVMRMLTDGISRVYSRFGSNNPDTTIIIDSSPNSMEGLVDQWIANHKNDKNILFSNHNKWSVQPYLFPIWEKDKSKTFPMFIGTTMKPSRLIEESERSSFSPEEVIDMPIDLLELAKDNPSKILKDYAAIPSGGVDEKLITNYEVIEDAFIPTLKNFYSYHHAPSSSISEGLLWDIVKKQVFIYSGMGGMYSFYRYPYVTRYISIDLARVADMASISMCHLERDIQGQKIFVVDFSLAIMKNKEEINMDAFRYLISDMVKYGQIKVGMVSLDGFQSDTTIQYLNRIGIDCIKLSVDYPIEPYMSAISALHQRRIKMGRNLIAKNNMKSLILSKTQNGKGSHNKVEHIKGEWCDLDNMDWEHSRCGYYGKDVMDSIVGCITLADRYGVLEPSYIYELPKDYEKEQMSIDSMLSQIETKFGLIVA